MQQSSVRGVGRGSARFASLIGSFLVGILIVSGLAHGETEFVQSQANFEKAIRNRSTSIYVIFATIVNDSTGETHAECVAAPFLLGAILKEYALGYDGPSVEKAIQIALANPSHVFRFTNEAALGKLPPFTKNAELFRSRYQQACDLVRQGKSVFLSDIGRRVLVDP
jgi:hypothetical protein